MFHALDGMRGIAAVFVAMRHTAFFHKLGVPGGYMAVDLFFVLSGFVIAHAYERRFERGLSVGRFLAMRYVRLWPVYALGATFGLAAALMHALPGRDSLTAAEVARTAPFAMAMLPGPHLRQMLYPVNSVAWSLALELMINAVYALAWRPLRRPLVLAATLAGTGAALVAAVLWFGKLDIGFLWRDWVGGLPRVAFSFTAGLAVYRLYRGGAWAPRLPAWAALAGLPVLFCLPLGEAAYPLACVLLVFPLMVLAVAAGPEPGPRQARLFAALGAASYPLYALHKPLGEIVVLGLRHARPHLLDHRPLLIGAPYLAALVGASLLVERFYDRPARRVLNAGVARVSLVLRQWARVPIELFAPAKGEDPIAER